MRYQNFVIQITAHGPEDLLLRVAESPVGESEAVVADPRSPLGRLLEESRRTEMGLDPALPEEEQARLGHRLYGALMQGPIQRRFLEALGRCGSRPDEGLRIKLQVDLHSPRLTAFQSLPWELLYRAETGTFLALDRRFAIVRHLRLPISGRRPSPPGRLRLLLVVASPIDRSPLQGADECRRISDTWRHAQGLEIDILTNATLDRLRARLLEGTYHGLHFIGHADLDGATGHGTLLLEDEGGRSAPCRADDLAIQLADRTALRWVFLNACTTGNIAARHPFGSLAAALLQKGIPALVAMQQMISDDAARLFSRAFYRRLAAGEGIDTAVSEGRLAIRRGPETRREWAYPMLFLRSEDGQLFAHPANAPAHGSSDTPSLSASTGVPKRWILGAALAGVLWLGLLALDVQDGLWRGPSTEVPGPHAVEPSGETAASIERTAEVPVHPPTAEGFATEKSAAEKPNEPDIVSRQVVVLRQGQTVEIPALDVHATVTFDASYGTPFGRLVLSGPGAPKGLRRTFMGPSILDLGQGRRLSIQHVDWVDLSVTLLAGPTAPP